jgi:MFS transporter, DHA2 family, multidrug resistance protein
MSQAVVVQDQPRLASVQTQRFLAALTLVPILGTVYQTIVLTDVTADVIRKGIEGDSYQMIWTTLTWGLATLYGVFLGLWGMPRYGQRLTLCVGLVFFVLGNLLCGAAVDVPTLAAAKIVEGLGKGATIVIARSMLYRQFDNALIIAVGFYGVVAYSTRPSTPLLTAYVNDLLSWRWIFWMNVPVGLIAIPMVLRFIRPDRPATPRRAPMDWVVVTIFGAWVSCLLFTFAWYRKWGGWSSNAFAMTATLSIVLPFVLVAWVRSGKSSDEGLPRILRVRTYVLAMVARALLLLNFSAVEAILAKYMTDLRDYPREDAGWILAPATLTMLLSTFLTTYFHRRSLRTIWLLTAVVGTAGCVWWLSSIDSFTPREHIMKVHALWGLFLGLFPPVFLTDEVEGLDPKDMAYAGGLAIICLVTTLLVVPIATSTTISAWSDRVFDSQRLNVRDNRPAVREAQARIADSYRQRGVTGPDAAALTGTVLGAFTKTESVARGFQNGLQFLSLTMLALGLPLVVLRYFSPPANQLIPDPPTPLLVSRP